MGLFDFLKKSGNTGKSSSFLGSKMKYADSSTIAEDERPYYQPDDYYVLVSNPGTPFETKVKSFEDRKKELYPSKGGLYVPEILLLEYCSYGKYPKPSSGYPGFWWFKYGIRDIGSALKSLEDRGFIAWASKDQMLEQLKIDELKEILRSSSLPVSGAKASLIARIRENINVEQLPDSMFSQRKYCLTPLGENELTENKYVPYMHKHSHATTEDASFGETFNVWDMNRLLAKENKEAEWQKIIGDIEERRFGVNMAGSFGAESVTKAGEKANEGSGESLKNEMLEYIKANRSAIKAAARAAKSGFDEEIKGLDYIKIGNDREALFHLLVAIEMKFDAPALYRETAKLLRKYDLQEEEVRVLKAGIKNLSSGNHHREELTKRLTSLEKKMNKK